MRFGTILARQSLREEGLDMVPHHSHAAEGNGALKMAGLPHASVVDASLESSGSLRGILTGVVAGGVIWLGVLALLVL